MTPLWWLVDKLSSVLEANERDAVRGDFAESGATGGQALRDMAGLVARRQAALWMDWRPWLALLGIVVPLGVLLTLASRMAVSRSAVPLWMYVDNWTMAHLESSGARQDLIDTGVSIFNSYLILAVWSWASGFVLGLASRRTIPVNGTLFCLIVSFVGLWQAVLPGRYHYSNAIVFSQAFYSVILPLTVQATLVILPSVWGIHQGCRVGKTPKGLRTVFWASVVTTIVSLALRNWVWVLCALAGQRACMEWVV